MEVLRPKVPVGRMVFNEITEHAIREAVAHPRDLDMQLVEAQESHHQRFLTTCQLKLYLLSMNLTLLCRKSLECIEAIELEKKPWLSTALGSLLL
jgi:hypothetical protein